MSEKKWSGREPRKIPQRGKKREAWCYADATGLDLYSHERGQGAVGKVRLTWAQLRRMLRDYGVKL